ncbi:MAG: flagellar hook-associated protein FlgK [Fuerstiella sp.]
MSYLSIGSSALRAAQVGINNASNNIANAGTEGYSRQRVEQADRAVDFRSGVFQGGGVDAVRITSFRDSAIESAITQSISQSSAAEFRVQSFEQLESVFVPGPGSIHEGVSEFFNRVERLAANPSESVLRQEVIGAGQDLAASISEIATVFRSFDGDTLRQAQTAVDAVNGLSGQISALTSQIQVAEAKGQTAHGLINDRGRLINSLAEYVDINSSSLQGTSPHLVGAGGGLLIGAATTTLSVSESANGGIQVNSSNGLKGVPVSGGSLGGLLQAADSVHLGLRSDFEEFASSLLSFIDEIQTTGLAVGQTTTALTGTRTVSEVDVPLSQADTIYPIQSGQIAVTVTDPVGNRRTTRIEVDRDVDSLRDVIGRLNGVNGITASVSPDGRAVLQSAIGFSFDFGGRPDEFPTSVSLLGTSVPRISGVYSDQSNTTLTAEVVIGGTVSVTNGVTFQVTDSDGASLGIFNAGEGYAAGEPIDLGNGLQVAFPPGTLEFGDTFSIQGNGRPDSTGLLGALGLNSLFTGDGLTDISVNPDLVSDPNRLALSRTGNLGDGGQIGRLASFRESPLFSGGTETTEERLASITGSIGVVLETQNQEVEQRALQRVELETARDSVSGVDVNEELLQLLEYQRAFQAASRFVSSVEDTLDELFRII